MKKTFGILEAGLIEEFLGKKIVVSKYIGPVLKRKEVTLFLGLCVLDSMEVPP